MSLLDLLLGKPLASDQARAECIGVAAGIPIFGLDALSSAAYGPEAALTLLIPLGAAGIDRKSTRLNSSHGYISYAVFCLKKKTASAVHPAASDLTTDHSHSTYTPASV